MLNAECVGWAYALVNEKFKPNDMKKFLVLLVLTIGFLATVAMSWGRFSQIMLEAGSLSHGASLDSSEGIEEVYPSDVIADGLEDSESLTFR